MLNKGKIVLALIFIGLVAYLLWFPTNENMLKTKVKDAFELANPGQVVTDINLIHSGAVYKAVFKLDGKLNEAYIDPSGKYLFPVRSNIKEAITSYQNQKNFFTCLAKKRVTLFGISSNNYTVAQLQTLGSSPYAGLIYQDCGGDNTQACLNANITSVPSWMIGDRYYAATLTPSQVAQLSNCTIYG